ncbi:MAG: hypothetical protein R3224_08540 [Balneolaceae bacterium]|nr:hypothetical protein [Balneolaceae bacterium]
MNHLHRIAAVMTAMGCSTTGRLNHPTAFATLWVQHSAEYDAVTRSVYRTAASTLALAQEDSCWTAAAEQKKPYASLSPGAAG